MAEPCGLTSGWSGLTRSGPHVAGTPRPVWAAVGPGLVGRGLLGGTMWVSQGPGG